MNLMLSFATIEPSIFIYIFQHQAFLNAWKVIKSSRKIESVLKMDLKFMATKDRKLIIQFGLFSLISNYAYISHGEEGLSLYVKIVQEKNFCIKIL